MDLASTLIRWFETMTSSMHTAMPAVVESYDPAKRLAVVLPAVRFKSSTGAMLDYKPIAGVPVMFPCTKNWEISGELVKGDTGLLIFAESSIGNWLAGSGAQVDPEDNTRFSLQDAIFIPGLLPVANAPAVKDGLYMRYKGGSVQINDGEVKVEGNLTVNGTVSANMDVVAMAQLPTAVHLGTHVHGTGVGPSTPPTPGS